MSANRNGLLYTNIIPVGEDAVKQDGVLFFYRCSQLGFSRIRTPAATPSAAYIVTTDEPP